MNGIAIVSILAIVVVVATSCGEHAREFPVADREPTRPDPGREPTWIDAERTVPVDPEAPQGAPSPAPEWSTGTWCLAGLGAIAAFAWLRRDRKQLTSD